MTEIVLPRLGWTMEEGVFMGWLKRDGDSVKAGEPIFSVEGDKSVQEIEALAGGTVRIAADGPGEGDTIPVGAVLGHIEQPGDTHPQPAAEIGAPRHRAISPRAKKAAQERGVDLAAVNGTGRDGRIRERDVLALGSPTSPRASSLRQAIAQRMVHSRNTTAPVTLTSTVDATNLVGLREQFKAVAAGADRPVPSFTDLFIKLTALALRNHPELNARRLDDGISIVSDIHIGVAVDTPVGLLVPVIRDVPALPLRALAAHTKVLAEKARARKLAPEELQGGTFTVTNLGAFGIDAFTPIINWPECAILGIGEIRKQPMVVDDRIVARHAVTLSLTFDHRLVDGAPAARFLKTLRAGVENPSAWLVE